MRRNEKINPLNRIYNAVFNSKATALTCMLLVAGLAAFGVLSLVGENKPAIALSMVGLVMLVNKVVVKIIE